jgi:hypothetical protein
MPTKLPPTRAWLVPYDGSSPLRFGSRDPEGVPEPIMDEIRRQIRTE